MKQAHTSRLVRAALVGTLAIGVTIGGVLAGALVVAPVVSRATQPDAAAQLTRLFDSAGSTAMNASLAMAERGAELATNAILSLPSPVVRFALPGLALVAIVGALSTVFVRRRTPARSLMPADASAVASPRGLARLTARGNARTTPKRHQTPRAVESLAARGATASDIARKTKLPIDAVQMLLTISSGARQLHPPAA